MVLHAVESISVKLKMSRANVANKKKRLLLRFIFLKNGNSNQSNWYVFWTFCESRNRFDWYRAHNIFEMFNIYRDVNFMRDEDENDVIFCLFSHYFIFNIWKSKHFICCFFSVLVLPVNRGRCCDASSRIQSLDIIAIRYIANRSVKHTWPIHSAHKDIVNIIRMTNCHEFTANLFASMALSVSSRFF